MSTKSHWHHTGGTSPPGAAQEPNAAHAGFAALHQLVLGAVQEPDATHDGFAQEQPQAPRSALPGRLLAALAGPTDGLSSSGRSGGRGLEESSDQHAPWTAHLRASEAFG